MGIQISNLLSSAAFDWKEVVDKLIEADSGPITALKKEQATNTDKITALNELKTSLIDLQDSLQTIRSDDIFAKRTVSTDTANNTWKATSSDNAPVGTYTIAVSQLATKAQLGGATNIGQGISATSDVSAVTLASMNTATAVSAGTFTVNGAQVTIATTDSLQDVFDHIATATGGDVTGSYDPVTDKISLTSGSGELILGAANDTSNFAAVMKLSNNGLGTVSSSAALGVVKTGSALASAGLQTVLTGQDGTGAGSFLINGVSVSYNVNTDTLSSLITRINKAGAGVTASYDAASDRMLLVNNSTGDVGMGVSDTTGNLMAALGLTTAAGAGFTRGKNALFTVNGGAQISSASNTLASSAHGITGLSVTVNTETTQTLQVESDTATMQTYLQNFIDKFNTVQSLIEEKTKITQTGGTVTTSLLSDNREVESWSTKLQSLAFNAISGLTGTITRLDHLGIDFNSTTRQLTIKDADKLATALSEKPDDVKDFFLNSSSGFVSQMYGYLTKAVASDSRQQSNLGKTNGDLDDQIATAQSRLDNEREMLTTAFLAMQDAQSNADTQNKYLTNTFFKSSNN